MELFQEYLMIAVVGKKSSSRLQNSSRSPQSAVKHDAAHLQISPVAEIFPFHSPLFFSASIALNPARPAYVPPHMRGAGRAPPSAAPSVTAGAPAFTSDPASNGTAALNGQYHASHAPVGPLPSSNGSTYAPPAARFAPSAGSGPPNPRGNEDWGFAPRSDGGRLGASAGFSSGGGGGAGGAYGGQRLQDGFGIWKDGKHVMGPRHMRMEKELYGEVGDAGVQVSVLSHVLNPVSHSRHRDERMPLLILYLPTALRYQL